MEYKELQKSNAFIDRRFGGAPLTHNSGWDQGALGEAVARMLTLRMHACSQRMTPR